MAPPGKASSYPVVKPDKIEFGKKYPLVISLSPGGDAQTSVHLWQNVAVSHSWLVFASKYSKNGLDMLDTIDKLTLTVRSVIREHPIDPGKVVAHGLSGCGTLSHMNISEKPDFIKAIIVNCCMMHEYIWKENAGKVPKNRTILMLASPTDFRYAEMKRDRTFLEQRGWPTPDKPGF
jgi:predicted peptidase